MLKTVNVLFEEHEVLTGELDKLEILISEDTINYTHLNNFFNKFISFWEKHEKREDEFFSKLRDISYGIPLNQILSEHEVLKKHLKTFQKSLKTGSERAKRKTLQKDGKILIDYLRRHMDEEDEVLSRLHQ
jgi:hypothetical protein